MQFPCQYFILNCWKYFPHLASQPLSKSYMYTWKFRPLPLRGAWSVAVADSLTVHSGSLLEVRCPGFRVRGEYISNDKMRDHRAIELHLALPGCSSSRLPPPTLTGSVPKTRGIQYCHHPMLTLMIACNNLNLDLYTGLAGEPKRVIPSI